MVAIVALGTGDIGALKRTLSSYKSRGILKLFAERLILTDGTNACCSNHYACCSKTAKEFNFDISRPEKGEITINTWRELFNQIKSKHIFLLEAGTVLTASANEIKTQLKTCMHLLAHHKVNLIRFMHSDNQNAKTDIIEKYKAYYPEQENKTDLIKFLKRKLYSHDSKHVIGASVCVHDHPEAVHPHEIIRYNDHCFITSSKYLNWTGKSIIVNKDWMLNVILQQVSKGIFRNKNINKALSGSWWEHQNFPIAICRGA